MDGLDDLIGNINDDFLAVLQHFAGERVAAVGGPQDGAAARQDAAHGCQVEREHAARGDEAIVPVHDPEALHSHTR